MTDDPASRAPRRGADPVREADAAAVAEGARVLHDGGLVAFPTETVYGLGADAENADAVGRVFTVKGRPAGHPLIVHLADATRLEDWARDVPDAAHVLAAACWPGPLTLILRRTPRVPDAVTGGRDTVGLRVPAHPVAHALLEAFGGGIAAPSANRFGRVSPTTAAHVRADLGTDVDLILDGGPCRVGVESTILDLSGGRAEVLRPGGVSLERLTELLGVEPGRWAGDGAARAPGMLAAHYAPRAHLELVDAELVARAAAAHLGRGVTVGVLAPVAIGDLPDAVLELEPAGEGEDYARVLYDRLRQADRLGLDVLLVVAPGPVGVGLAVRDRLERAATGSGTDPEDLP